MKEMLVTRTEISFIERDDLVGVLLENVHLTECVSELRECYVRARPEIRRERIGLIARLNADDGLFRRVRIHFVDTTRTKRCERIQSETGV